MYYFPEPMFNKLSSLGYIYILILAMLKHSDLGTYAIAVL